MLFAAVSAVALALLPVSLAAISITGPSETSYWVQNASNTITWTFESGDPNPISIIISNGNNTFLNGNFSIAEFVDLSQKFFTVTNVTLKVADGYNVNFINPQNQSQIYATGPTFSVKAPGTAAAPTANGSVTSGSSSAAPSGTASSGSSSSSGSPAPTPTGSFGSSGASSVLRSSGSTLGVIATCGIAALFAVLL